MASELEQLLGISAAETANLSGRLRQKLVNFVLQWEHYAAAGACLDVLIADRPDLVSLLDARARLQLALQAPDAALETMQARHRLRESLSSHALLTRIYLALGDSDHALQLAVQMTQDAPEKVTGWALLGDVHLARAELEQAEAAYRRQLGLSKSNRPAFMGLMEVYWARDDWVTASAYAVRVQSSDEPGPVPSVYLRRLLAFFKAAGELNRASEVQELLDRRYQTALSILRKAIADELAGPVRVVAEKELGARVASPAEPRPSALPTPAPPSAAERERILAAARQHFNFERLLPGQVEVISAVMRGEDVLAVLPTGGGKSFCYQLPALLDEHGTTLVISPLIALMKDQLDSLPPAVKRVATAFNSSLGRDALRKQLDGLERGRYRLVYAAPERLRQPPFLAALRRCGLSRLVIDEAHCVSLWGHDFRPDYLALGKVRHLLGDPPLLAMTATAPERVRRDIVQRLGALKLAAVDVHRPNLQLEVVKARDLDEKMARLIQICRSETGAGIVYAGTRDRCEKLAAVLRRQGVEANHYHAGIPNRAAVQDDFMAGRIRVVVATVAFGLGIDKPDIRFIIHFAPAPSLEAYYQEAGRAGRDGNRSRCILFFSRADKSLLTRRARRDVIPVEFLRDVYRATRGRLDGANIGRVAPDDLCRDVCCEGTPLRVAIGFLESANLLRRHLDAPRAALITARCEPHAGNDADFATFVEAARLRVGQRLELDLVAVARQAGLDPVMIEMQVLHWQESGLLDYRPAGRDMLLEILPPPADAAERIANLLERSGSLGHQRTLEIASYVRTTRCRHGYLNAYLGGRQLSACEACDNCLGLDISADLPAEDRSEALLMVLRCVAGTQRGIGRLSLVYAMHASKRSPKWTRSLPCYGALQHRSRTVVEKLVASAVDAEFLAEHTLDHGGIVLCLTPSGRRALHDPAVLGELKQDARGAREQKTIVS